MKNHLNSYIILIIAFIFSFTIVGYVKNEMMVKIDWVAGANIWSKLKWYYGYNFFSNLFPSLILAIIIIFISYLIARKKA